MNIKEERKRLAALGSEQLAVNIVNGELNDLVARYADYEESEDDPHGHGKRVPYIGWFWRTVDFASDEPYIPIGHCGSFVGFMENNKWDHPQRALTSEETGQVIDIVLAAYDLSQKGGILAEIWANTKAKLDELWPLMQTFEVEVAGWWIFGPQGRVAHADTAEQADRLIVSLQEAAPGFVYRKEEA